MRFRLSIYERSYLDDHSNGKKIYDTFESSLLYEKIFRKIQAALRHFYEEFEGSRRGIFKINDGINIMFRISFMAKKDQSGFEDATESEIELFEKGEIQLYNVEYIAMISEIKSVSEEEVDNALEGIGFEVKEG